MTDRVIRELLKFKINWLLIEISFELIKSETIYETSAANRQLFEFELKSDIIVENIV